MKKQFSKTISFLLVSLLTLGVFVGCGNNTTNNTPNNKHQTETPNKNNNNNATTNNPTTNNATTNNNGSNTNTNKNESTNSGTEKTFTLDELSKYDGKNGQPAYIAVDGVVYDVTSNFPNGEHHGCKAGTDATESIKNVSHGSGILSNSPVVGKLAH